MPAEETRARPSLSVDAFHRGRFHLAQPLEKGHRAGIDAMLLGGAAPEDFSGHVADFGAGAGAAGFAVAARCENARVTLVERSAEMARCARSSLEFSENTQIAKRIQLLEADVELTGKERIQAGLADRSFDFIIMNPPFNAASDRASPDPLKRDAHVMADGMFERWLRSAAAVARPGAQVAVIARPVSMVEILDALKGRFGSPEILPIHPRPDSDAIRIVVRARQGARGSLKLLPALDLHENGRAFSARADDIINGRSTLFD